MSIDAILAERAGRWRVKSMNLTQVAEDNEATAARMSGVPVVMLAPQGEVHDRNAAEVDRINRQIYEDERSLARIEEAAARRQAIDPYNRMGRSGPATELAEPYLATARRARVDAAWYAKKAEMAGQGAFLTDPQRPADAEDDAALSAASRAGRVVARPGWYAELASQLGYPVAVGR